jgi:nitrogen fixation/metabolism regulation signal transduction histidine kinase
VNRLRTRLIGVFLAATLGPLAATLWIATSLLEHSLSYATTTELDEVSQSLEQTGRGLYQRERESLRSDVQAGRVEGNRFPGGDRGHWPQRLQSFFDSGEPERFLISGAEGDQLDYAVRRGNDVWLYSRKLSGVGLGRVARQLARAHEIVERGSVQDLRRGFMYVFAALAAAVWTISLVALTWMASRISRPIQDLTMCLEKLAGGDLTVRVETQSAGEIGRAMEAFNHMAEQLQQSRERLIYLTRLAGWQALARKMAHELKNSLTPIRLTMEELVARHADGDRAFLDQAADIVTQEVNALERRVRAFSEFAAEPPVSPTILDVNSVLEDRVSFLKTAHPEVIYNLRLAGGSLRAVADEDLMKGVLTNLLENAAQAAGSGGVVLASTQAAGNKVAIEVHDSGPGLSAHVKQSLFEPTISFKKGGMGLGLSIARKSAVLCGGDIVLVKGELGGAAFRVLLPMAAAS